MDKLSKDHSLFLRVSSSARVRGVARGCVGLLASVISCFSAQLVNEESTDQAIPNSFSSCAKDLWIPRYSPSEKPGVSIGPITSSVTIGPGGEVKSVKTSGGTEEAQREVKSWLQESKFFSKCSGKTVTIMFTFEIEGLPSDYPFSWVVFKGPNHFVVHSLARKPHIFRTPNIPKKE
jgi:hypothetical protein